MAADKFTAEQVAAALRDTKGMVTLAARQLGCSYNTVRRYISTYSTVKQALTEAHEGLGDQVELTLANEALGQRAKDGSWIREPNIAALIFLAKTKFKARGYTERHELTGADGGAMQIAAADYRANLTALAPKDDNP